MRKQLGDGYEYRTVRQLRELDRLSDYFNRRESPVLPPRKLSFAARFAVGCFLICGMLALMTLFVLVGGDWNPWIWISGRMCQ